MSAQARFLTHDACEVPRDFTRLSNWLATAILAGSDGTCLPPASSLGNGEDCRQNNVIYLIGLVVVVLAILSFLGFH